MGTKLITLSGELAEAMAEGGFVDIATAAKHLSISRSSLYQLMERGEISYAKFGKSRRIPRKGLLDYASKCLVVA
jgi:excisionase family DNA binding protein